MSAGLPGLGDPDHEIAGSDHGVAVAVLGGDVHFYGHARPLLDRVAADQPRVVGGAAGDDHDALDVGEDRLVQGALLVEVDPVAARGAVGDRLGDGVGLFVDLLEHERLEAALLGGLGVPVDGVGGALHRDSRDGRDRDALGAQGDDLAALDVLHGARLVQEGGHVGGDELLPLAATDDQRALLARCDECLGLVEAHRDEGVVALHLRVGGPHGGGEIAGVVVGEQVCDHLGVGLGGEGATLGAQALAQGHVVLDDPVDHDVGAIGAVVVRVGVLLADPPVGRPAGVADADAGGPGEESNGCSAGLGGAVALPQLGLERREVADCAHGLDAILGDDRDSGAVIAAVLKALEPVQQQLTRRAPADVAHDSAHPSEDTSGRHGVLGIGRLGQSACDR